MDLSVSARARAMATDNNKKSENIATKKTESLNVRAFIRNIMAALAHGIRIPTHTHTRALNFSLE